MKAALGYPALDTGSAQTEVKQLRERDHPVLVRGEFGDCPAG